MAAVNNDDIRTLEATRQRLLGLVNALQSFCRNLELNPLLPPWPELQRSFILLQQQLGNTVTHITSNTEFLQAAHAYPVPAKFPREQEGMLGVLLRKRLDPSVEHWIEDGMQPTKASKPDDQESSNSQGSLRLKREDAEGFWATALQTAVAEANKIPWNADFTIEEIVNGTENVQTGLRRKLKFKPPVEKKTDEDEYSEDEGSDGEDEDDAEDEQAEDTMDTDAEKEDTIDQGEQSFPNIPPVPLEELFRHMWTGVMPPSTQTTVMSGALGSTVRMPNK